MRIFPKKTKMRNEIFRSYTIFDLLVILAVFAVVLLIISSDLSYKWYLSIGIAALCGVMFIPNGDRIFYQDIGNMIVFIFTKKKYRTVAELSEISEITSEGYLRFSSGERAFVIELGQKDFFMQSDDDRNLDIGSLGAVIDLCDKVQLIKCEKYIKYDEYVKTLFDKLTATEDETKRKILTAQIGIYDNLNNLNDRAIAAFYLCVYAKSPSELTNLIKPVMSELEMLKLQPQLLDPTQTAIFIRRLQDRYFDEREADGLDRKELLKWSQSQSVRFTSKQCIIDDIDTATIALTEYPIEASDGWGAGIFNLPDTKVVLTMRKVDKFTAAKRIDKTMLTLSTKQFENERATELSAQETHQQTLAALIDSLNNGSESLFDTSLTVTALNYRLDKNFRKNVQREIKSYGFRTSPLSFSQKTAYKASQLGAKRGFKGYERGINSGSLGAVFPFVNTCVADRDGLNYGYSVQSGLPFIFDIFKRGGAFQNSNAFIIGKSGSGKSYFIKQFTTMQWASGAKIFLLDPEAEYLTLTRSLSGTVIDVGNASEGRINPFHIYQILNEDGSPASAKQTFTSHLKTLESFFKITLETDNADILELINILTVNAYNSIGIFEDTDISALDEKDFPTFSTLEQQLKLMAQKERDEYITQRLKSLELMLRKFTSGRYSDIWNGYSTLSSTTAITDFNFQSLFASHNNIVANAQMLLVFRFIEQQIINVRNTNNGGENNRIIIIPDEAHLFIDAKFPIALDFFYSTSKRIRKYGGSFIPATQNISDWNANEELRSKTSAIIKNSQYSFIFKLSPPDMHDLLDIYTVGANGFNDNEQNSILRAETGQTFFVSDGIRSSVKIEVNDIIKELF